MNFLKDAEVGFGSGIFGVEEGEKVKVCVEVVGTNCTIPFSFSINILSSFTGKY